MRVSEAALALITRVNFQGATEYLAQWNQAWQAYSLVGGHVELGESFRECCVREIEEELEIQSGIDFRVETESLGPMLEYDAVSKAKGVMTHYRVQLFCTQILTLEATKKIDDCLDNCWLTPQEILSGAAKSGRLVADQVGRTFRYFGVFDGASFRELNRSN